MQAHEKDYKQTLNLPKTDFSMKAGLSEKEPRLIDFWDHMDLYRQLRTSRAQCPRFVLHDGPPYANGDIHIGHALNKVLKDIVIKYKSLKGFDAPFTPGWDCHGLPVEHQLFKKLDLKKDEIPQIEFRAKAHEYANHYVTLQAEQFKRLGVIADWKKPYRTLDPAYESEVLQAFAELARKGFVYRDLKPVNWCTVCETALAEAEVEYADHSSPSVFVAFQVRDEKFKDGKHFLIIWTTTPWTLVANVAVAVHPDRTYVSVKTGDRIYFVMKELLVSVAQKLHFKEYKVRGEFQGKDLEGLRYVHPFLPREGKVVLAEYVSHEEGSGCVHTAPGHGMEDYVTGQKYHLPMVMPVNAKGCFDETAGDLRGTHVFKANDLIVDMLKKSGALLGAEKITHSYPHCWRCKSPIIFRATRQWFLSIGHRQLREKAVRAIREAITWVPSSGAERISSMVALRPDWCLSRQRYWGVPIPSVECLACKKEILDAELIAKVAAVIAREGSDAWFTKEISYFDKDFACPHCGAKDLRKQNDIIDVWFESGASYRSVLMRQTPALYPADLYLEGSDQHRGWFQSTLMISMGVDEKPAFRSVLTHGFVVDGDGRKMSKSLGNVVSPHDVIKKLGADVLRLWVASCDYSEDVKISGEILDRLVEAYRKIRNTLRYIAGNLYDFDPSKDRVAQGQLQAFDRWMLGEFYRLLRDLDTAYEHYEFHKVIKHAYEFCVVDLSSFYLDILKDRLYTSRSDSTARRSAQTVLFEIGRYLSIALSPILAFTMEEFWQHLPGKDCASVHVARWPADLAYAVTEESQDYAIILKMRTVVLKALELKRQAQDIGSPLEAAVTLEVTQDELYKVLNRHRDELASLFIVSRVSMHKTDTLAGEYVEKDEELGIGVKVQKARGVKCLRCWNIRDDVGGDASFPGLCARCVHAIR